MKRPLLGAGAALGIMMLGKGALRMADGGAPFPLAAATCTAGTVLLILVFTAYYKRPKPNGTGRAGLGVSKRRGRTPPP